jgi:hypothetical protein
VLILRQLPRHSGSADAPIAPAVDDPWGEIYLLLNFSLAWLVIMCSYPPSGGVLSRG